ncbi:MAG: uroporphyrinogen decarboxylase [Pseudomonadota bacterium]
MRAPHPILVERAETRRFLKPFCGDATWPPPVWLMRQAGRYLPEYRETRKQAGGFLDLCYNPDLATEVTLQPIRRYGFDAAILFSDILVIPDALGQTVRFVEGEGPRLDPITDNAGLSILSADRLHEHLAPVYQTVSQLREQLPTETALIGFCGAPWTVATYVVAGKGTPDQAPTRSWAYRDPDGFAKLIDILTESSIEYLSRQVQAGAEVLQIFDTWAGALPIDQFEKWVIKPTERMVTELRSRHPEVPIIGFARGCGMNLRRFVEETGVDGAGCDTSQDMVLARQTFGDSNRPVLQGNLDPLVLIAGGESQDRQVDRICEAMKGSPFIFNLGHGITPPTPPENVTRLMDRVRNR